MKRIIALTLALVMLLAFTACAKKDQKEQTDFEYVKSKGKLVVGITDFKPMDYKDEKGEWIGFDADMAKEFAKSLGVEVEFVQIDWGKKAFELDAKAIDCVWNGMTLTDEVKASMSTSNPYCNNQQVIIVKKDKAANYKSVADCKDLQFAVETGSAGAKQAVANNFKATEVLDQAKALSEVKSGAADAAIIDSLMAAAMVGEGTGYSDLTYILPLNDELYGVGFRKGSDLTEKLNQFLKDTYKSGKMQEIAKKYGTEAALVEQK
ncbi:MAG: transporter substrate-binding domain-containing protein [Ruminococcaceae bacterium]|nr:transporter substrate-binding domain-containing protein [Oscillospiraceae bacterium]